MHIVESQASAGFETTYTHKPAFWKLRCSTSKGLMEAARAFKVTYLEGSFSLKLSIGRAM